MINYLIIIPNLIDDDHDLVLYHNCKHKVKVNITKVHKETKKKNMFQLFLILRKKKKTFKYFSFLIFSTFSIFNNIKMSKNETLANEANQKNQTGSIQLPDGFVFLHEYYEKEIANNKKITQTIEPIQEHLRYGIYIINIKYKNL